MGAVCACRREDRTGISPESIHGVQDSSAETANEEDNGFERDEVASPGNYDRTGINQAAHAVFSPNGTTLTISHWDVSGSIDITSVYSSLGSYSCAWTATDQTGSVIAIPPTTLQLTPDQNDTSNEENRNGTCSFSIALPANPGTYSFTVVVSPGGIPYTDGNVTIVRPAPPSVSCSPRSHVLEGSDITSTCNTSEIGQPEGRLVWVKNGNVHSPINSGDYGNSSLVMRPQTLSLADHERTTFRCDVDWIVRVLGETYTALVADRPASPVVTCTPADYVIEGDDVNCTCRTSYIGRPEGRLVWIKDDDVKDTIITGNYGNVSLVMSETLMREDHNRTTFRCDVDWIERVSGEIYTANVVARPVPPVISCTPSGHVPENSDLTCTCSTSDIGQPKGRLIWIKDDDVNNTINSGSHSDTSLVMTPQTLTLADDNRTTFRCDVDWMERVPGETCTALVGYGPLNLFFNSTSSEVRENQTAQFCCQADGRPTPRLSVIQRYKGREVASGLSLLTHLVSRARCEDGGVYSCFASNGMRPDTENDLTLTVKCKPRYASTTNRPSVVFKDVPVTLVFNMTAYPTPAFSSVTFLGNSYPFTKENETDNGISLNTSCAQRTMPLFIATCVITVYNVTSADDTGFYKIVLTNEEGSGEFIFQVELSKETVSGNDASAAMPVTVVLGMGIGLAVLFVAIVILAIFFVYVWRRGWEMPCAGKPSATEQDRPGSDMYLTPIASESNIYVEPSGGSETYVEPTEHVYGNVPPPKAPRRR